MPEAGIEEGVETPNLTSDPGINEGSNECGDIEATGEEEGNNSLFPDGIGVDVADTGIGENTEKMGVAGAADS